MDTSSFVPHSPWRGLTQKMHRHLEKLRNAGVFTEEQAARRGLRCVHARVGAATASEVLWLYGCVDPTDGVFVDAKFQALGPPALLAVADSVCTLIVGKNYEQVRRITPELVDKQLRDAADVLAFSAGTALYLDKVCSALAQLAALCTDIALPEQISSPVPRQLEAPEVGGIIPAEWEVWTKAEKLQRIEEVIAEQIRPYIELDEGGVRVVDLAGVGDKEVSIAYSGACTTCYSSVGTTLTTIQEILRAQVHPQLVVVPNLDDLALS